MYLFRQLEADSVFDDAHGLVERFCAAKVILSILVSEGYQ